MIVINDGTKKFHHQTDGRDQQIAGCLKDFRNKPFPVKAKLEYVKNVITVSLGAGEYFRATCLFVLICCLSTFTLDNVE